jgi:hypothetical protein
MRWRSPSGTCQILAQPRNLLPLLLDQLGPFRGVAAAHAPVMPEFSRRYKSDPVTKYKFRYAAARVTVHRSRREGGLQVGTQLTARFARSFGQAGEPGSVEHTPGERAERHAKAQIPPCIGGPHDRGICVLH